MDQAAPADQGVLRDLGKRRKTQIWIAVSVYVLVAIVRKRLKLEVSLYTLMQVFSVTVFEQASIESVIRQTADSSGVLLMDNQLNLFSD